MTDKDTEPVLVVTNKKGRLIHVGQPDLFSGKLLADYTKRGYNIKTITIAAYRKRNWKWHWEK